MRISRLEEVKSWLRVERNFHAVFAVIAGCIAFGKGFGLPYNWAATQAQFDYRFGLVRLGLFGSICSWLHLHIIDYRVFCCVAFVLLFLLLFLLFRMALRSGLAAPFAGLFIVLIAADYSISFTTNIVGYLDIPLAISLLLALRTRGRWAHLLAVAAAAVIGCLLHELYLVAFLPLSMTNLLRRAEDEGLSWRNLLPPALLAVVPVLVVFALCGHNPLTEDQMQAFDRDWHLHANFFVRDDYFLVLKKPLSACFQDALGFFHAGEWWAEESFLGIAFLPTAFFFLFLSWRFLGEKRKWTRRYVAFAVLCPLSLNLIAVDFTRWLNFVALNAIIAAMVAARSLDAAPKVPLPLQPERPFGILTRQVAMLLIAINLATDAGMFVRGTGYPFMDHWRRFRENRLDHRPILGYHDPRIYRFLGTEK